MQLDYLNLLYLETHNAFSLISTVPQIMTVLMQAQH